MQVSVAPFLFAILCLFGISRASQHNAPHFSVNNEKGRGRTLPKKDNSLVTPVVVNINFQQSLGTITSHFVGVTIDTGAVEHNWATLDFSSKKVQTLARALVPTFFRLGGTSADAMTYVLDTGRDHSDHSTIMAPAKPGFNMTAEQWVTINEFVQTVGWDFIFDFNALKRNADGSWNPDNARQLLQFSADRNYTIAGFEMGNEYNLFKRMYNTTLSPSQLAKDVASLQSLLSEFPKYYGSFIIGPETAGSPADYFETFLAAGGSKVVRAASFHHYYFAGADRILSHFTNVKIMDSFKHQVDSVFNQTRSVDPLLPVWLSETSSAYNGGALGQSDRFVAGFLWLDKLGVASSKGIQTVIRQDFYGGNYALVDIDLNPNPDFWLTVLYKRIVRGAVFNATGRHDVRVYAACANTDNFKAGSLVLYMLNPNNYSVTFDMTQLDHMPRQRYTLTAGDSDGLVSKFVSLNGKKLELVNDELPDLKPEMAPSGLETVAPYSYTFLVFEEARVSICLH
ncbi:heparanase-like [Littorina saxatilis]|uniref:Glycoside hydrolase family 79 n=1 Tax=Littorina saxatilis TaxID=31220 RepID=A0AAN9AUF0_9CAEN